MTEYKTLEAPIQLKNSISKWIGDWVLEDDEIIIAGGFIRAFFAGEDPNDMDIYTKSEQAIHNLDAKLLLEKWDKTFTTDRADSYIRNGKMVQLIKVVHGDIPTILEEFDFTICKAAYSNKEIVIYKNFFQDLAARILIYQGSRWPLASLKRAIKYTKRGYHICDENLIALAEDISSKIDFKNIDEVEEHISGMDPLGGRSIRAID